MPLEFCPVASFPSVPSLCSHKQEPNNLKMVSGIRTCDAVKEKVVYIFTQTYWKLVEKAGDGDVYLLIENSSS